MTIEFGPFQLDESGRLLKLQGREVELQPRVFELLVYLIKNEARVVPKDELLDALWPAVTVTDNSVQRAVSSLRSVLRKGGLENAIRSYPRNGYRFMLNGAKADTDELAPAAETAKAAFLQQRWGEAAANYETAGACTELSGDDLDQWALALQCLGRPADAIPVLGRAIVAHTKSSSAGAAAASAVALSIIHFERGEAAVAKGWIAHAEELMARSDPGVATGLIMWMTSRVAAFEGDPKRALELAEATYGFGRDQGIVKIESLGLMYRGFYRLSLGDTQGGLADQDRAAALALSHDVDPMTGGVLYCNILWACRTFGDWARADQWTLSYQKFCADSRMRFSGSCQLHRAEVLGIRGSLADAVAHVTEALACLPQDAPWAVGDAHRVLGDLQSAVGNHDAAFAAYETSYALGWDPEPGRALLLLEVGETEAAHAGLERSLMGQNWWTLQRQGMLLAHLALVAAHSGRREKAQALISDLAEQTDRWPMPSIRALTNEASAVLAHFDGEPEKALSRLHLARQLWTSVGSRLHAARLRIRIARLLLERSDSIGANTEVRAAQAVADELDSPRLRRQCAELQADIQRLQTVRAQAAGL